MKKLLLTLMLTVASSSAMAVWVEVSSSDDLGITVYADPSSIRKADNKLEMWFLSDYKKVRGLRSARYMSVVSQIECDCMEEQVRPGHGTFYEGNMARGRLVSTGLSSLNWMPVSPGSIHEHLLIFACGK
jgi:hypothetical protein